MPVGTTDIHIRKGWPPFLTDDPEPAPYEHFEVAFYAGARAPAMSRLARCPELTSLWNRGRGSIPCRDRSGLLQTARRRPGGRIWRYRARRKIPLRRRGRIRVDAADRYLSDDRNPDRQHRPRFGRGARAHVPSHLLQKQFGDWTMFGGGYWVNPGFKARNYWFFGYAVERKITDRLTLGGRGFYQTPDTLHDHTSQGFNLGGIYDLADDTNHPCCSRPTRNPAGARFQSILLAIWPTN